MEITTTSLISSGLFSSLTDLQQDSIQAILSECEAQGVTDERRVAYILATAYHEAYNPKKPELRLTPIKEFGGEAYLKSKKYYPYFGRGFSQLTWWGNYKKEGIRLGINLTDNPDLMLLLPNAANSHVWCMTHGTYTGKKLSDYIHDDTCDFINARRIVNGTDRASDIAGYAEKFLKCL